jgi:hypothetical protein
VAELDRMKAALAAYVRSLFAGLDYYASYPAKVVAQNGDGTLELQPDDPRIPGLSNVPIRYGVPGVKATVASGARVLLGFAAGDPGKPQAELWESAVPTEIVIGTGSTQPVGLGTALRTELDAIWTKLVALGAHTHVTPVGASGPPSSGVVVKTAQVVESSLVKVKA